MGEIDLVEIQEDKPLPPRAQTPSHSALAN